MAAYERGDYETALRLWRSLAEQGDAFAQANLAAAQGAPNGKGLRDQVAKSMTHEQIAEAQKLAREWKPKK